MENTVKNKYRLRDVLYGPKTIEELIELYNLPLEKFMSLRIEERQKRTDIFRYEMRHLWNKKENTKEILERILFT